MLFAKRRITKTTTTTIIIIYKRTRLEEIL